MGGNGNEPPFTGLSKYFNTYTISGRRNFVLATYASVVAVCLLIKLKPKKKTAITEKGP